jgi:hypothetical protein
LWFVVLVPASVFFELFVESIKVDSLSFVIFLSILYDNKNTLSYIFVIP